MHSGLRLHLWWGNVKPVILTLFCIIHPRGSWIKAMDLSRNVTKYQCLRALSAFNLPADCPGTPAPPSGWFLFKVQCEPLSFLTNCFVRVVLKKPRCRWSGPRALNEIECLELGTVCPHSPRENRFVRLHTPKLWLGSFLLALVNKHDQNDLATLEHWRLW